MKVDKFKLALLPVTSVVFGIFLLMLIVYITASLPIFEKEGLAIPTYGRRAKLGRSFTAFLQRYTEAYTPL